MSVHGMGDVRFYFLMMSFASQSERRKVGRKGRGHQQSLQVSVPGTLQSSLLNHFWAGLCQAIDFLVGWPCLLGGTLLLSRCVLSAQHRDDCSSADLWVPDWWLTLQDSGACLNSYQERHKISSEPCICFFINQGSTTILGARLFRLYDKYPGKPLLMVTCPCNW